MLKLKGHTISREEVAVPLITRPRNLKTEPRVNHQALQAVYKRSPISGRYQDTRTPRVQDLGWPPKGERHDWDAEGHGLEEDKTEGLPNGGIHRDVHKLKIRPRLWDLTRKRHVALDPQFADELIKLTLIAG
jgi:hypothetical protein